MHNGAGGNRLYTRVYGLELIRNSFFFFFFFFFIFFVDQNTFGLAPRAFCFCCCMLRSNAQFFLSSWSAVFNQHRGPDFVATEATAAI
jgi:hypothetical protein